MPDDLTLTDLATGAPLPFMAAGQTYQIRQPSPEEYDDARAVQQAYLRLWHARPEVQAIQDLPPSPQEVATYERAAQQAADQAALAEPGSLKQRAMQDRAAFYRATLAHWTAADEVAGDRALLARDRWLTMRLLQTERGQPVLNLRAPAAEVERAWAALPLEVKDAARPVIWRALAGVEAAPF